MSNRWFIQWYLVRGIMLCVVLFQMVPTSFGQAFGIDIGYRDIQSLKGGPHVSLLYNPNSLWSFGVGCTFNPNHRITPEADQIAYSSDLRQFFAATLYVNYQVYEINRLKLSLGLINGITYRDYWTYGYLPYSKIPNSPPYIHMAYIFLDKISAFSQNARFSYHSLQLQSKYRIGRRTTLAQSFGLGVVTTSAVELSVTEGGWFVNFPNISIGLSYYLGKDVRDDYKNERDEDFRNLISFAYSDGIISDGFNFKYTNYSNTFISEIGIVINAPIIHHGKVNRVYHQKGKVRGLSDILGLHIGVAKPIQIFNLTAFPFYSLEIKRQRLLPSWFKDTGLRVPEQYQWLVAKDDRIYAYYNYISESPVISFESFVGLGARFDLSDKVFIEERLGVGLGFYIHEFEDYYPGPKKHHEFVFPYFSLGLGYKL